MRSKIAGLALSGMIAVGSSVALSPGAGAAPGGGKAQGTSTLELVLLDSTDGLAHHGQRVTFNASTSESSEPHVDVSCTQDGVVVYRNQAGYFDGYPWPWNQTMTLSSRAWTGGAADCTATMYYFDGRKTPTAATLSFHVEA